MAPLVGAIVVKRKTTESGGGSRSEPTDPVTRSVGEGLLTRRCDQAHPARARSVLRRPKCSPTPGAAPSVASMLNVVVLAARFGPSDQQRISMSDSCHRGHATGCAVPILPSDHNSPVRWGFRDLRRRPVVEAASRAVEYPASLREGSPPEVSDGTDTSRKHGLSPAGGRSVRAVPGDGERRLARTSLGRCGSEVAARFGLVLDQAEDLPLDEEARVFSGPRDARSTRSC